MYIDENYEINGILPKFLSLLLAGTNWYRVTERDSLKNK